MNEDRTGTYVQRVEDEQIPRWYHKPISAIDSIYKVIVLAVEVCMLFLGELSNVSYLFFC